MPVVYEFDTGENLLRTRCEGELFFEEVFRHFAELENDTAIPNSVDVLLDLTGTESFPDIEQVRVLAGEVDRIQMRFNWGVFAIAAKAGPVYEAVQIFQAHAKDFFERSAVFHTREEADRWLKLVRPRRGS